MPKSRYDNDPRVRVWGDGDRTFDTPDGAHYDATPDHHGGRTDRWVVGPSTAPVEVQRDHDAYMAWQATLPRFDSLDEALASVLGDPR